MAVWGEHDGNSTTNKLERKRTLPIYFSFILTIVPSLVEHYKQCYSYVLLEDTSGRYRVKPLKPELIKEFTERDLVPRKHLCKFYK